MTEYILNIILFPFIHKQAGHYGFIGDNKFQSELVRETVENPYMKNTEIEGMGSWQKEARNTTLENMAVAYAINCPITPGILLMHINRYLKACFEFDSNPLPTLRTYFEGFVWKYLELTGPKYYDNSAHEKGLAHVIHNSDYIFNLATNTRLVTATRLIFTDVHRRICWEANNEFDSKTQNFKDNFYTSWCREAVKAGKGHIFCLAQGEPLQLKEIQN